jgi:hypothetical protein
LVAYIVFGCEAWRLDVTRIAFAIAAILISLAHARGANLTAKVVDDSGQLVLSDVFYYDGSQPTPFRTTDPPGIAKIPEDCKTIKLLRAHPHDTGAYFESHMIPCSNPVVLHVLSKKTPFGVALKAFEFKIKLPDGTPGVVIMKAGIQSSKTEKGDKCDVAVRTVVDQRTFRTVGDEWSEINKDKSAKLPAESLSMDLPNFSVSLPFTCKSAEGRIMSLKTNAAAQVIRNFGKGAAEAYVKPE